MPSSISSEEVEHSTCCRRCSIRYLLQTPIRRFLTFIILFLIIALSIVAIFLEIFVVYPKRPSQLIGTTTPLFETTDYDEYMDEMHTSQ